MLTRLKVSGFKNLVDVDVRFGPFTCIAGDNGAGKSNLFDAIQFLSALADQPLVAAAATVRGDSPQTMDVRRLFTQTGDSQMAEMTFEAEIIVPKGGRDEVGREIVPIITYLRYTLRLAIRRSQSTLPGKGTSLEIISEELVPVKPSEATPAISFPHTSAWRQSTVRMAPPADMHLTEQFLNGPFISTMEGKSERIITLYPELHTEGQSKSPSATSLTRTLLSTTESTLTPTAYAARLEMRSWQLLQLEPDALRTPDPFSASAHIDSNGAHIATTLYHFAHEQNTFPMSNAEPTDPQQIYAQVANRLAELIGEVRDVGIDVDEGRQLLTLYIRDQHGATHIARMLSDGTLRFLALAILEQDSQPGLYCIEEPENGIHPDRIPALIQLLGDIAVDANAPVDVDNPLRQVIISTHSPAVVSYVPDDSLLYAQVSEGVRGKKRFSKANFRWLADTWRARADPNRRKIVARGMILPYLNPVVLSAAEPNGKSDHPRRVIDRPDIQSIISPAGPVQEGA